MHARPPLKKILLSSLLATLTFVFQQQARAGDLGLMSSSYDWSGAYLGANVGATRDDINITRQTEYIGLVQLMPAEQTLIDAAHDELDTSSYGFSGGLMAGYNWQVEQVVFGLETDINALSLHGNMRRDVSGLFDTLFNDPHLQARDKASYEADVFGTLRGRLGFAVDNVMLYGTGGLAYAHTKTNSELFVQDSTGAARWAASDSIWNLGWTIGGGLEYGIDRWSLGVEYLYVDLLPTDWHSSSGLDLASQWSMDYGFSVLRATGKMRF